MQNIHVVWGGPYSHAEALQLNSPSDFGLYQYYGDHHVYGDSALLYIGKAQDQTFARRVSQHNWELWASSNIFIYTGKVHSDELLVLHEWRRQIDLAERILIQSHSPSFNSSNLNLINHKGEDTRVLNWGTRMKLLPEVSVSRWEGMFAVGNKLKGNFQPQSR
jgi:hypothetical protein